MGSQLERTIQIHRMGYFLIDRTPKIDPNFANMLKTTAVIRFSLEYGQAVRRVELLLESRKVVVVSDKTSITYSFEDLLQ